MATNAATMEETTTLEPPRRRKRTVPPQVFLRGLMGVYDLGAMVFLIYYAVKWDKTPDPWHEEEKGTFNALAQIGMSLAAATIGVTAALLAVGWEVYCAISGTTTENETTDATANAPFLVDLPVAVLALAGWIANFLDATIRTSYQGYPIPHDRPWILHQSIAAGLVIGLWLLHGFVLIGLCCACCCCGQSRTTRKQKIQAAQLQAPWPQQVVPVMEVVQVDGKLVPVSREVKYLTVVGAQVGGVAAVPGAQYVSVPVPAAQDRGAGVADATAPSRYA